MSSKFVLCYELFKKFDCIGSCTWSIERRKIFYFNDENIDLEIMKYWLSSHAEMFGLSAMDGNCLLK